MWRLPHFGLERRRKEEADMASSAIFVRFQSMMFFLQVLRIRATLDNGLRTIESWRETKVSTSMS